MSKRRNIATWMITLLLALAFMGAGFAKVTGQEMMIQSFTLFGLPDWFRMLIGGLEIVGGILLLLPISTGPAAFGLSIIMVGAIACHAMFTPISGAIPATVLLLLLTYIYCTRKITIPSFLQKPVIA